MNSTPKHTVPSEAGSLQASPAAALRNLDPSLDLSDTRSIVKYSTRPQVKQAIKSLHRSELLPHLFKIRGRPFSLKDHQQFKTMYDNEYVPDVIYICGRQIGKSLNTSRSEILDLITIPYFQILYVAPLQQQTQRYSTLYINEAIQSCETASLLQMHDLEGELAESRIIKSVGHQALGNGSGIQLTYAKTSSDRARGIFADRIDFDEIQDQLVDNIPIISESLTASAWGLRRFTGTAKTADNTIEKLFQKSAQCEWAMKCSHCTCWNFPTEDGRVLDMIKADGLHCVQCGGKLNVRDGEWVPAYPERMSTFRGYHIPQIVIPAIVENPHNWAKIKRKVFSTPLPLFMQEVLGISCSVGARIITQKDIDNNSILPSITDLQKKLKDYVITVGGVDWGGAEHESFTVHTVIGIRRDGKIDVLWARRFIGFDPDEMLTEIAKAHRFYKCAMLAADYGMGFDKNVMLGSRFGITVIQIALVSQHQLLNYSPTLGQHRWTVDKTTSLTYLFLAIKYGRVRFPPATEFKIYTDDLLSPYEEVSESGGLTYKRYLRNPSQPDDFCMALDFACLLGMRLINSTMTDLVPEHAFDGGATEAGAPAIVEINPADVLSSLKT